MIVNSEDMTWEEWKNAALCFASDKAAAGYINNQKMIRAWQNGEDPTGWAAYLAKLFE